ncbi:MAG: hypothetical protein WCG80_19350, partial [Spirochaetales bacterium]
EFLSFLREVDKNLPGDLADIGGCFGIEDRIFAKHPQDCKRAAELLAKAIQVEVGFGTYKNEIRKWLLDKKCNPAHVEEQMARVADLSSYFCED